MPVHEHCVSVSLELATDEQLVYAVATIRQLELEGVIESKLTIANEYFLLTVAVDYPKHLAPDGYLNDEAINTLRQQYNVPRWAVVAEIYGDSWTIFAKKRQIKKRLALKFLEAAPHIHSHHKGVPSDYFIGNSFFGDPSEINLVEHRKGKIWFAPVVPFDGEQTLFVMNGCKKIFHKYQFDFASGLLLFNPRTVIAIA